MRSILFSFFRVSRISPLFLGCLCWINARCNWRFL